MESHSILSIFQSHLAATEVFGVWIKFLPFSGALEHDFFSHIIGNDNPNWLIFRRGWNHQPVFCCSNSQIVIFCLLEVQKMWQHGVMSCHSQMTHGPFETIATAVNTIGFSIGHRWCQEQKWRDTYEMREEQWFCRAYSTSFPSWFVGGVVPVVPLCTTEGTVETHIVWFIVVADTQGTTPNFLVHGNNLQYWQDMTRFAYLLVRPANENPWKYMKIILQAAGRLPNWVYFGGGHCEITLLVSFYSLFSCWRWFFFVAMFDFSRLPPGARCPRWNSKLATFPSS